MPLKPGILTQLYREQQAQQQAQGQSPQTAPAPRAPQEEPPEQKEERIVQIPLDALEDFPKELHPFRPATAERLGELKQDILTNGILAPLLVREVAPERYQILAGHNRKRAASMANYRNVPCIVKDVTDDEAINIMLSDNLYQRDDLLPSEKAFAYKLQLETMQRKAGRPSAENGATTLPHFQGKKTRDIIAEKSGESHEQVRKYIRLTYLIPELLQKVDDKAIGFQIGVTLSYLTEEAQETVYTYYFIDNTNQHIDQSLANDLRTIDSDPDQCITPELLDILAQQRAERRFRQVKVQMKDIRKYFSPEVSKEDVVETIEKALDYYYHNRQLGGTT